MGGGGLGMVVLGARDGKWPKNGKKLRLCSGARDENGKKLRLCSGFLAEFSLNLAKKREKAKKSQKNDYTTEKNCQKSGIPGKTSP